MARIFRRYGSRVESVTPDFDPAAMTEVGFRRDRREQWGLEEFLDAHVIVRLEELDAEAVDAVQERAERAMLGILEEKLSALMASLDAGEFLVIESEAGRDYPRTRYLQEGVTSPITRYFLDRPLRLAVMRARESGAPDPAEAGPSHPAPSNP